MFSTYELAAQPATSSVALPLTSFNKFKLGKEPVLLALSQLWPCDPSQSSVHAFHTPSLTRASKPVVYFVCSLFCG